MGFELRKVQVSWPLGMPLSRAEIDERLRLATIAMGSALGKRLQSGGRSEPSPETFAALCSANLGGKGGGRGTKGLTPRQRVRPDRQLDHGPRRNLPTAHIERLAGRGARPPPGTTADAPW